MVKRRCTTRVTSNQKSTEEEVQTPEQTQIMHETRRRTRSQTKTLSDTDPLCQPESDSHFEQQSSSPLESHSHAQLQMYTYTQGSGDVKVQHEAPTGPQLDASVELHRSPKHLGQTQGLRTPRSATISYEEFCDGVHNYVEAQHGAPTVSQQESPMDLEHTPQHLQVKCIQSSSRTTILGPSGESRRTRGFTKLSRIWNLPEGYKVGVEFSKNFQPIKQEGGLLKRFLGTCARKSHLVPINFKSWPKVPSTYKQGLWDIIKSKFEIPMAHEREIKKVLLHRVGLTWRGYKCHLKTQYFDENKSVEEMIANVPPRVDPEQWSSLVALWNTSEMKTLSQANKALRKHLTILHTTGQKSFEDIAEEMKEKDGVAPTEAELYILTHKRKDGTAINEDSANKIAEMEKLLAQRQENSQSSNEDIGWQDDTDGGGGDDDGDDIDYHVREESNDRMRGLRSGSTPSRKSSRLSRTVASARKDYDTRQVDMETMSGPEDSTQVGKDGVKVVKDRRAQMEMRAKEVIEGTNCVLDFNTPSRNTSRFSPIAASARMVSEDNMRQVSEDRTAGCGDTRQGVEGRIRVEERRRDKNVRDRVRNIPSRNTSCLSPIVANATVVPEKDMRQVDEERLRDYEEGRKQLEEERKRFEEERKRVEEDRRKVEEDRRQLQEDRKLAEEDRKKSDSEIRFLKERLTWMENLVSRLLPMGNSTTIPREVPHLRSDPNYKARTHSATSSHAQEHYFTDQ